MTLAAGGLLVAACGDNNGAGDPLARLMDDGDVAAVAPGAMTPPATTPPPPRFCPTGDCSGSPLAFWTLDDCNSATTQLNDSAFSSISHPAFRAVSAACVASIDGEGIRLSGPDDIIYAPDQPDFVFNQGLTVAAWINPDSVNGTQSIFRKRLDSSSSFVLAVDGHKLTFALRLTSGKTLAISAPIQAKRFTHVAATYDGAQALLYVNGAVAASAKAAGTIAPGAGPVFVGNDASGRELVGTVDDIWLNTLAAPASVIQALTCIHGTPVVALTPGTTPAETAGTSVPFDLAITNGDSASCPASTFEAIPEFGSPLSAPFPYPVTIAAGQTAHLAVSVKSLKMSAVGSYPVQYLVANESNFQLQATASATYVVGTGPISCDGTPPFSAQLTDTFESPLGLPFTYAATGLTPPTVTTLFNSDGTIQGAQVSANPGATTDSTASFVGFGFGFGNPPCLDASAYTGIQFTVTGDLGTCSLQLSLTPSENNSVQNGPEGVCTAASCAGPFSGTFGVGTTVVNFADLTAGSPLATLDATALNAIGWNLTVPTDGVTAPCVASFTVTNISFVPSSPPPPPPPPPPPRM
ncbi:MAG TPA: LamG domain-containing protein [Polyangia bacterium]|nr:LamG domain-containing protein [Polyangia bacterium]